MCNKTSFISQNVVFLFDPLINLKFQMKNIEFCVNFCIDYNYPVYHYLFIVL